MTHPLCNPLCISSPQRTAFFSEMRLYFSVFPRFPDLPSTGGGGKLGNRGGIEAQERPERLAWHYHRCAATTDPFGRTHFCLFDCFPLFREGKRKNGKTEKSKSRLFAHKCRLVRHETHFSFHMHTYVLRSAKPQRCDYGDRGSKAGVRCEKYLKTMLRSVVQAAHASAVEESTRPALAV